MVLRLSVLVGLCLCSALAVAMPNVQSKWFWSSDVPEPRWNKLKVTFLGKDTIFGNGKSFDDLPRTVAEADAANYVEISNGDCSNGGAYNGYRYTFGDDQSLVLLFDAQGTIAGIQMAILKSDVLIQANLYKYDSVSMYQSDVVNGQNVYVTTAYFVEPSTICTTGRPNEALQTEGTGTGLYLQNGPTPADLITVPPKRPDAITDGWSKNNCFAFMGYHNFYKSEEFGLTNCTDYRPSFLLFDKEEGDLVGFGLTATGHATSPNSRFEYPPASAIKMIVGSDVAECLTNQADTIGMTTMHVYFTGDYAKRCTIFDN